MNNSIFQTLLRNPPKLTVVKDAREVIINLRSCMCDNRSKITFKKNEEGDFKINTHSDAYSNFQIKYDRDTLEWAADEGDWEKVFKMINTGVELCEEVKSR